MVSATECLILRDARKPNGEPLVEGSAVTGFTDAEDEQNRDSSGIGRFFHLTAKSTSLQIRCFSAIRPAAEFVAQLGAQNVGVSRLLLTGQHPVSVFVLAERACCLACLWMR